jgi:hypothetical protein
MPGEVNVELAYVPMVGEAVIGAKEVFAAATGWEAINFQVAYTNAPIIVELYIPQVTVKKLNATGKIFIEDFTNKEATVLQEGIFEGITAASNTGPVIVKTRFVPAQLAKNPTAEERVLRITGEPSAESFTVVKASATVVPYIKIDSLQRQ